jgi:hypothetical protein
MAKTHDRPSDPTLNEALEKLPLFDDVFLRMQAFSLSLLNQWLNQLEAELVADLITQERTPPDTMFVAAIGQLWVFGIYELLRTWRQRANDLLDFASRVRAAKGPARRKLIDEKKRALQRPGLDQLGSDMRWSQFRKVINSVRFTDRLTKAVDKFEYTFRRLEALRVALAKHEMPKAKGIPATFPGYARIDTVTGSILWQTSLMGNEVDVLTRRGIADDCIAIARARKRPIFSRSIQQKLQRISKADWFAWGVHRIVVTLKDGTEHADVFVAWYKEIVGIGGNNVRPFKVEDVIAVRLQK